MDPPNKHADFQPEELLRLSQAARLVPGRDNGKRVYVNTLWRWCSKGLKGVRLKSTMAGGHRCTTRRWLTEFFEALNGLTAAGGDSPPRPRTPGQRRKASERAVEELRAAWQRPRPPSG